MFTDSYGYVARKDLSEDKIMDFIGGNYENFEENSAPVSSSARVADTYDDYTRKYGLRTEKANVFNRLGILNRRTASFDSNHRVIVSYDNVNYGFFKYTNFRVKFKAKKRRRICIKIFRRRRCRTLWSYWVFRSAEKMVVGMDKLNAELTYPYRFEGADYIDAHSQWIKRANGMTLHLTYHGLMKSDIVKHWQNSFYTFGGHISNNYGQDAAKAVWKEGTKRLEEFISKRTESFIRSSTNYKDAPAVVVIPRNDKEHYFFNGVAEYRNTKERKVTFPMSQFIGFAGSISSGSGIKPDIPDSQKFEITSGSIFGAAYYNGRWRGIRMTGL